MRNLRGKDAWGVHPVLELCENLTSLISILNFCLVQTHGAPAAVAPSSAAIGAIGAIAGTIGPGVPGSKGKKEVLAALSISQRSTLCLISD